MASLAPPNNATLRLLRRRGRTQVFRERCGGLELAMVRIPAGAFVMGSPPEEPERGESEGPQRKVSLAEFLMSQTPITQAQWREVAGWEPPEGGWWERSLRLNPSRFESTGKRVSEETQGSQEDSSSGVWGCMALLDGEDNTDQRPVERVSWHDTMEFCRRLNSRLGPAAGRVYTLPSEAQWEYACRAGTTMPFAFGETLTTELANYDGNDTYTNGPKGKYLRQTTPVGLFPANDWGLHDMHGNVWEWCLDGWHASYEGAPEDGSAWLTRRDCEEKGEKEGEKTKKVTRLVRGGSWYRYPRDCRSARREHNAPDSASNVVGFRVVCLPQGPSLAP